MSAMSSLTKELILLVLQFLGDEKYSETVHRLEMESGLFFDIKHFEELVMRGEWDEMERYLSGFTKVEDNRYSMKIFFEIRKQKYLEALDRRDRGAAAEILMKDLKCFAKYNEELFKEIALLLTLENFRENKELRAYRDTNTSRTTMFIELKKLIEANPYFQDKLKFPEVQKQRLRTLVNQSLNWQHQLCKAPQTDPDIKTLFVDHACPLPQQNGPGPQVPPHVSPFMNSIPNARAFPQMAQGVQQYHHQQQQLSWITGAPPMPHAGIPMSHVPAVGPSNTIAHLNRPLSPTNGNATVDYHLPDNDPAPKRPRIGQSNQLSNAHYPVTHSDVAQIHDSTDELLPKTLVVTLGQGSTVTSMEFHPSRATLLLVGTNNGDIALWDIASQERLDYKNFEVWDLSSCSSLLQESLTKDPAILVKRVAWSHDGSQIGVAYSKHLVHLYTYNRREDLIQYLEIEAHVGGVNDLVFPEPNGLVVVITCGDDKLIKIWDTTSGSVLFTFEGHETPVYSICPQSRENTKFIFSTSFDGKIKAWLYDHSEPKVDFTAPGNSCTRLAYTDDGKRLFSCGTSKDGDTHIVEWNESEGTLKQRYKGLQKPSTGVVQFDMTKNRFLAAGDDFLIKFWDMDSAALLTTTDAEGGLQASPHVRFNKSGSLLAVSTKENSIKVLASVDGLKLLRSCENRSSDAVRLVSEAMTKVPTIRPSSSVSAMTATGAAMANRDDLVPSVAESQNGDTPSMEDVKPRIINEPIEKSKPSKLPEINESSQCSLMMLPDDFSSAKKLKITETETKETVDKCKRSEEEMRKEDREVEEEITSLSKKMNRLKEELSRVKEAAQLLMTTSADGLGELGSMIEENNEDFLKRLSEYTAEIKTVKAYLLEQFAEKRKLKKEMRELERRLKLKEEELLAKEEEKRVELEDMKKKREERNKEINNTTRERRREAVEKERRKGMRIEMTKRRQREQDQFEKHVKRMRQATDERDGKQKEMGKPVRSELKSTAKPSKVVFEPSTPKNYQIWSNELTEEQSYEMTPYMDSDTEEVYNREGKYIPLWARKENLNQIILRNQDLDPEAIFATKRSFNLDEVFGSR